MTLDTLLWANHICDCACGCMDKIIYVWSWTKHAMEVGKASCGGVELPHHSCTCQGIKASHQTVAKQNYDGVAKL